MSSNRNVLLSVDEILGLVASDGGNDGDQDQDEDQDENGEDSQAMAITSPPTPMLSRYNSLGDSSFANSYAAAAAAPTINSRAQTWHAAPKIDTEMDGSERSSSGGSASKSSSDQPPTHGQIQQQRTVESMPRRDRQRKENESIENSSATPPPSSLSTSSPASESWQMPAALYHSQSANASTKPSSRFQIFEQSNQQTKSTSKTTAPRRSSDSRFDIFEDKLREEEDINGIIL